MELPYRFISSTIFYPTFRTTKFSIEEGVRSQETEFRKFKRQYQFERCGRARPVNACG